MVEKKGEIVMPAIPNESCEKFDMEYEPATQSTEAVIARPRVGWD